MLGSDAMANARKVSVDVTARRERRSEPVATRWAEASSRRGMVCTPHRLASEAGIAALRDGGNALDAAVAAVATIAVVYPHMNGIGGDSFWLIYDAAHERLAGLNAAERAHPARLASGRFVQRELARTLALVAEGGAEEFYRGDLGKRIATGAAALGSPLAAADFAEHRAEWVEPLRVPYREGHAASLPPPTQGFAALVILGLLDGFDVR